MSGMDGAKAGARRAAYQKIRHDCACGRVLRGNLATSHLRACETNLRESGWPLDAGMKEVLLKECGGRRQAPTYAHIVRAVERGLGKIYLERRQRGDKTPLPWIEYRDEVWRLADAAVVNPAAGASS
ncbi:hypothetical protein [Mycolicibacterium fortuitum]|uniref:hypothetical protein n=1 Tax=Mycolicibacterium fortuitum TaxID=1766 RepID=UPI0007EB0BD3|nr:hypothetical protein [Mycolicibacterium fortuitum]OBF77110.1 hypothetical protein A5751_23325 [Mycolicibacterium fortuitum]